VKELHMKKTIAVTLAALSIVGFAWANSETKKENHPEQSQWDKVKHEKVVVMDKTHDCKPTPPHAVPDAGSTAALLSLGMFSLGFARKFVV
jgi:VPDSG-CTERM motif